MFRGKKGKKEKKKIKTQNDKIVETDMDIWCYTDIKKVIIRAMQAAARIICNLVKMYQEYSFSSIFLHIFGNIKKTEWLFFLHWIFVERLEFQW